MAKEKVDKLEKLKKLAMIDDLIGQQTKPVEQQSSDAASQSAEALVEETMKEFEASDETKEYLERMALDMEVAVSGATNKIALMAAGSIPASFRDLALAYNKLKIMESQITQLAKLARDAIVNDPMAPDAFVVGGLTFTYDTQTVTVFDTAEWKKVDPTGYNAMKLLYSKPQSRTTFRVTATKGRDFAKGVGL